VSEAAWILPTLVMLPLLAGIAAFLAPRHGAACGILAALANLVLVVFASLQLLAQGVLEQSVGHWHPPLGIALRLDGLGACMLLMTALVALAISLYASSYFRGRAAAGYWPLWLFLIAALQALFISRDLFNLYVTLELLGIAAVALTALEGGREALSAAMRYLLASLAGSLAYLLGVALTYHGAGSVDLAIVASAFGADHGSAQVAALTLMTTGLLLKGALFPLHFWLPAAHGSAAAPVSAALSALVVKGALFILLRLWLEAFQGTAQLLFPPLAVLGGAAVIWGSLQALAQVRAKLLIAYSTVAQIGYLFLVLPLVIRDGAAWAALLLLAFAHGLAKAAMFLAAGNLQSHAGHDRIADLNRVVQRMPMTVAALAVAGVSIMGLPPSGGFNAKWMLLQSAALQGRWDIAAVLLVGGLLAAAYMFKLVEQAFTGGEDDGAVHDVPRVREVSALALALLSVGLGFLSMPWLALATAGAALPVVAGVP
jgi:formate hydrogenlyase subunit 3/multisubunit Na+/H+ antiporter MnhD subunit